MTDIKELAEQLAKLHGMEHHPLRSFETAAAAYLKRALAPEPSDETPADWPFGGDHWEPGDRQEDFLRAWAYGELEQRVWTEAGGARQETADVIINAARKGLGL